MVPLRSGNLEVAAISAGLGLGLLVELGAIGGRDGRAIVNFRELAGRASAAASWSSSTSSAAGPIGAGGLALVDELGGLGRRTFARPRHHMLCRRIRPRRKGPPLLGPVLDIQSVIRRWSSATGGRRSARGAVDGELGGLGFAEALELDVDLGLTPSPPPRARGPTQI